MQFYNIATKVSCRKKCYYFWWSTWLFNEPKLCITGIVNSVFLEERAMSPSSPGTLWTPYCDSILGFTFAKCQPVDTDRSIKRLSLFPIAKSGGWALLDSFEVKLKHTVMSARCIGASDQWSFSIDGFWREVGVTGLYPSSPFHVLYLSYCWTNSRIASDLRSHDAHVTSLWCNAPTCSVRSSPVLIFPLITWFNFNPSMDK